MYCTSARKEIFLWKMGHNSEGKISTLHMSELRMQKTNADLLFLWCGALDVPFLFCKTFCRCHYIRRFFVTKFGFLPIVNFNGCWVDENSNFSRISLQQYYTWFLTLFVDITYRLNSHGECVICVEKISFLHTPNSAYWVIN